MRYFLLFTFLAISQPAYAIRVVNLDTVPQILIVNNGGEMKQITLAPNALYTTFGPMVDLQVKGHGPKRADPFSDYVIWKGGKLRIQNTHQPQHLR